MNVPLRLPLSLLLFLLSAHVLSPIAEAQNATSAAAEDLAAELAPSDTQEEEKGLWDGIFSSIVDFFVDESPDPESDDSQNLQDTEGKGLAGQQDVEVSAVTEAITEGVQENTSAVDGTVVLPNQPRRPRNLRPTQVEDSDITASHVYQATVNLISEIVILRNAMNVTDSPERVAFRQHQTPIHAYAKSLEVMQKTARIQKRLGMIPADVGHIPVKPLTLIDLHDVVQAIIEELRRIKRQMIVKHDIEFAPFVGGKAPSHVYENLLHASLLLDGLVGRSTTPSDVYVQVLQIHDEMNLIAAELQVSLDVNPPTVEHAKQPTAVAQQVIRAAYKLVDVQTRLGMDASNVPNFTLANVTSSDVLDATNFLLAEIARIKTHLNIQLTANRLHKAEKMTTTDVFARLLLVIKNLETIGKAAEQAG